MPTRRAPRSGAYARANVVTVSGEQPNLVADREHPKTIMFDFEQPVIAVQRRLCELNDLRGNCSGLSRVPF
jgi:hypothetical protein